MGFFSFRKVAEKTKQMVGFTSMTGKDGGWKPSSNDRNTNMIEEARKFAQQLKSLHKDLTVLDKQIESSFGTMKAVLSSPLPRVYDTTAAGTLPLEKDAPIVGQAVNLEDITAAAADMRHKLQQEVLHPLDQWLAAYRSIKTSNKKVEDLRLELDSRRRAEMALQDKLAAQKAKISEVAEAKRPAAQAKASETEFKLQFEIDKVTRLTQRYQEIEAEVFNALLMLIKDTTVLKQYAAASLFIYQKCFSNAYLAFDLSAPLYQPPAPPAHPAPSVAIAPSSPPSISGSPAQPLKPYGADKIKAEGATPMSVTPAASKRPSHAGEEVEAPNKPGTPEQQVEAPVAEEASPAPPAWYVDARNNPENVAEDSDSDGESRPKNPFA